MKKLLSYLITALLLLLLCFSLAACDMFKDIGGDDEGEEGLPQIDNALDLDTYLPTPDEDGQYTEGEDYYTSKSVDLVTEVNGNYTTARPFTLDKDDESKRIYRNIYFYEEDFFQVIYYKKFGDLGKIYAALSDGTDGEYAEVENAGDGTPLQINIKKQGVYDLILDTETFAIDMVKVADIDTPVYETIKSCELNIHTSESHTYSPMTLDAATNEYYILADIPANASIGFYNASHMGRYKMTVEWGLQNTLVYWNSTNPLQVQVHVSGTYKIYFNAKTYVLRLELQNPDTASYYCQVEWQKGNELSPVDSATPYLFEYVVEAPEYGELPSFFPHLGWKYSLSLVDEGEYVLGDNSVREGGTYKLTVNLKEFTLTVEKLS